MYGGWWMYGEWWMDRVNGGWMVGLSFVYLRYRGHTHTFVQTRIPVSIALSREFISPSIPHLQHCPSNSRAKENDSQRYFSTVG